MTGLLCAVFSNLQLIIVLILAFFLLVIACIFFYYIYLLVFKPNLRAEINERSRSFALEKKQILQEKKHAEKELLRSEKRIDEKTKKANEDKRQAEQMKQELIAQGIKEAEANKMIVMTLPELLMLKRLEASDLSADFIINAITRRVLIDFKFESRNDVSDFKVPVNITTDFTVGALKSYILSLPDTISFGKGGKSATTFKIGGKAFALLYDNGDAFKLTIKTGPYYGNRLSQLYPSFFEKAKFPYGMLWFSVAKADDCSLELLKLMTSISYNIAKAGY